MRFYGFVKDIVGTSSFGLETAQTTTLRDLFDLLVKRFGETLRDRLLTDTGELEANVRVFVGNTQATSLEAPLGDGERPSAEVKVFVLSATAGG
ncbi:MAG: MoaD/ThiS family protein [Candidatus Binatia bacterium]